MIKNNFDFLRFAFAFMVVLAHIYVLSQNGNSFSLFGHVDSYLPVCGFFIISGFLITKSYNRSKSLAEYYVKRAKRLLPAYIFIIVITALTFAAISSLSFKSYFSTVDFYKYLLANLTFLNFLHPCLPGVFNQNVMCAVNGSLWTLKVEVSFYIILPLLFYIVNRFKSPLIVLSVLYVAVLIHNYFLAHFLEKSNFSLYFTLSHQLPALMTYFIAGMLLHFYFDFLLKHKTLLAIIALPMFLFEYFNHFQYLQPITLSILLFYFSYSTKFKFLNEFGKHGDFSYGIYIFHFPLIQLFVYWGLFTGDHNPWISFLILITIVMTVALCSWNFIEKPFLKSRTKL